MEIAKITSKGQITIPKSIRETLGVSDGDKVIFIQEGDNIIVKNASLEALYRVQEAFKGVAEELGLTSEEDIVQLVKEIRKEKGNHHKCG